MSAKRIDPARVAPTTVARLIARLGRTSVGALTVMCVVAMFQSPGRAQSGSVVIDPLPFTLSYTVTGNLAVAGLICCRSRIMRITIRVSRPERFTLERQVRG